MCLGGGNGHGWESGHKNLLSVVEENVLENEAHVDSPLDQANKAAPMIVLISRHEKLFFF